jgi:hypothetical protein
MGAGVPGMSWSENCRLWSASMGYIRMVGGLALVINPDGCNPRLGKIHPSFPFAAVLAIKLGARCRPPVFAGTAPRSRKESSQPHLEPWSVLSCLLVWDCFHEMLLKFHLLGQWESSTASFWLGMKCKTWLGHQPASQAPLCHYLTPHPDQMPCPACLLFNPGDSSYSSQKHLLHFLRLAWHWCLHTWQYPPQNSFNEREDIKTRRTWAGRFGNLASRMVTRTGHLSNSLGSYNIATRLLAQVRMLCSAWCSTEGYKTIG